MKKEKKRRTRVEPSGSIKVDHHVLAEVKEYCKENGLYVSYFATEALREKLIKNKT